MRKPTLTNHESTQLAALFHLMSNPSRLRIMNALCHAEHCVNELSEIAGSSQANVSQHLTLLRANGLLARRTSANKVYYGYLCPTLRTQIAKLIHAAALIEMQPVLSKLNQHSANERNTTFPREMT